MSSPPLLPERDAALRAAADLTIRRAGWFRRAQHLGALPPTRVSALAAVVVLGQGGKRVTWSRSAELSENELERLFDTAKLTRTKLAVRTFQVVRDPSTAIAIACTHCMVRPGFGPCPRCIGTGQLPVVSEDGKEQWSACDCAGGFVRCTRCGGTRRLVRADVESITDSIEAVEEWIVPNDAAAAARALRSLGAPVQSESFACALESPRVESAYRGAAAVVTPRFFDFDLLDAAERARDRIAQLAGTLHPLETQTYAVPFLFVQYTLGKQQLAAVVRRHDDGQHVAALCP